MSETKNKDIYEIIQGIYQAVANGQNLENNENKPEFKDDEKGDKIGNGNKSRNFFVKVNANKMMITFETITDIKEVLEKDKYVESIKSNLASIEKFLKSEYKKVTGNTLTITKEGECNSMTQNINGTKAFTVARQIYTVSGLPEVKDEHTEEAIKTYNSMDTMLKESWNRYLKE